RRSLVGSTDRIPSGSAGISSVGRMVTSSSTAGTSRRTWVSRDQDAESRDRKSTRLNSSHLVISYAVFCLKKKKKKKRKQKQTKQNKIQKKKKINIKLKEQHYKCIHKCYR